MKNSREYIEPHTREERAHLGLRVEKSRLERLNDFLDYAVPKPLGIAAGVGLLFIIGMETYSYFNRRNFEQQLQQIRAQQNDGLTNNVSTYEFLK